MTSLHPDLSLLDRPTVRSPLLDELRLTYAPILEKIARGALQRELDQELPTEAVGWLKAAGFGALRVPTRYGGRGASLPELVQLWIDVAAADSNLPQAFRGHFAFVEDRIWQVAKGYDQRPWFDRFRAGQIAGNAWSEIGTAAVGDQATVLRRATDGSYRLDGQKFYTTGTIYAEWADVHARLEPPVIDGVVGRDGVPREASVIAIVDTSDPGVTILDDWNGFGQLGTGSGTTTFADVRVPAAHVMPFGERFVYQTALYQLNLLATLVGIGRAALADVAEQVRRRERTYSHANAPRVRDDAQVLARIGEIASAVLVAEAATIRVATAVQEVADLAGCPEDARAANEVAEIESSAAQVVVTDLVLRATSDLFDTLGASATARTAGLDRHWRNARTVASHNPRILKARVVGEHVVNGTPPPYAWSIGATRRDQAWAR